MNKLKYLGTVLYKQRIVRRNKREDYENRCIKRSLASGRNVSMEVKKGLRNSIVLLTFMMEGWTWTWNKVQQSRVLCEISYLRGACGVTRWKGESNGSVYERCDKGTCADV